MDLLFRKRRFRRIQRGLSRFRGRASDWLKAWRAGLNRVGWRLSGAVQRRAMIARMRRADIILASPRTLRLSLVSIAYRLVLRARYVHSMLYLGRGRVLHTTTRHGVVVDAVPRKIYRGDRYLVLRAQALDAAQRRRVIREALQRRHWKLDLAGLITNVPARLMGLRKPLLRMEKNRVWCSKLIYDAYAASGVELLPGRSAGTVTSEDLGSSPRLHRV